MNENKLNYDINLNLNNNKEVANNLDELRIQLEEIKEVASEIEIPYIHPIINFYGCSFNFADEGSAESRYYNGDDVYNPRKEV